MDRRNKSKGGRGVGVQRKNLQGNGKITDQDALKQLSEAVRLVEKHYPLPRCKHGSALRDGADELLEPLCGCRAESSILIECPTYVVEQLLKVINESCFVNGAGSCDVKWYEEEIFNESFLYEKVGKDQARTILSIWSRFKQVVKILQKVRGINVDIGWED